MNKPISMTINDTKKALADVINNSNLPPCILKMILDGINNEVQVLVLDELRKDTQKYEELSLREKETQETNSLTE